MSSVCQGWCNLFPVSALSDIFLSTDDSNISSISLTILRTTNKGNQVFGHLDDCQLLACSQMIHNGATNHRATLSFRALKCQRNTV